MVLWLRAANRERSATRRPLAEVFAGVLLTLRNTVEEIKALIQQLSPDEVVAFLDSYAEINVAAWDHQIAADNAAGRLDWLVQVALDDLAARRCTQR